MTQRTLRAHRLAKVDEEIRERLLRLVLDPAEPGVDRAVLRHQLMGEEAHLGKPELAGSAKRELQQRPADSGSLERRVDGNVVDPQMPPTGFQDDYAPDLLVLRVDPCL